MRTRNLSDDGLNLFNIAICNGKNIKHNADSYKRYSDIKDMPVKTYCYSKIKQSWTHFRNCISSGCDYRSFWIPHIQEEVETRA